MKHDKAEPPTIKSFKDLGLLAAIRGGGLDKLVGAKVIMKVKK